MGQIKLDKSNKKLKKAVKGWASFLGADTLFALGVQFGHEDIIAWSAFCVIASIGVIMYCLAVVMEDDNA